ncbi:MAG: histone deacetylase family protein [Cypionkella sp.]
MIVFHHPGQRAHDPKFFLSSGAAKPSPEHPARIDALLSGVQSLGLTVQSPADLGIDAIAAVHPARYLTFLQTIHERWTRIEGASAEVVPNVHPANRTDGYPLSAVGQAGFHMTDTACPISAQTWGAACLSAQCAIAGSGLILEGARAAYALCRPPGHHAFAELAGGFCYLNNTAIAAQQLTLSGRKVAILDVDVHHGNGTQGIFYDRPDVLTVSIHAHPERFYPFFWGYPTERGEAAGDGANLNICLPRGTRDAAYMTALQQALEAITLWGADTLVLALGLDAFVGDPFQGLAVTTEGFAQIGTEIAALRLPTLIVQEGGYLSPELGENLAAVLKAFT